MLSPCCLCVCELPLLINFWMLQPIFTKPGHGTRAHFNGSHHKSFPSVCLDICDEVEVTFNWIIIYIRGVSWPYHYNSMILFGKTFTKFPYIINNIWKRSVWSENITYVKLSFWSMEPISQPWLFPSNNILILFFPVFTVNDFGSSPLCFNRTGVCWPTTNASVASILNLLFS
jgi:hypothetical protein